MKTAAIVAAVLSLFATSAPVGNIPSQPGREASTLVAASTDVDWLGEIAKSADTATRLWRSGRPIGQPKDLRIQAYARLGELGTPESIGEQHRVEDALRGRPLIPSGASLNGTWPHPGWHMGDSTPIPVAQARGSDGRRWVLVPGDMLGEHQLFLLLCTTDDACTRPKPVGPWSMRYTQVEATLVETAPGQMELALIPKGMVAPSIMDGTAPLERPALPAPEKRSLVLTDIERDSDGDGWTDIEERTIGLNPDERDSDSDGIDDAHDGAPLFAPPRADAQKDDMDILQRAIFAAFGLSESRWVLFSRDEKVTRVQPWGLSAPVIFKDKPLKVDLTKGGPGGVYVSWKIARKSDGEAVVDISDWEGPLAAGGQNIVLRRKQNQWVVVSRQTTWIS
jgi:hypothetical protein